MCVEDICSYIRTYVCVSCVHIVCLICGICCICMCIVVSASCGLHPNPPPLAGAGAPDAGRLLRRGGAGARRVAVRSLGRPDRPRCVGFRRGRRLRRATAGPLRGGAAAGSPPRTPARMRSRLCGFGLRCAPMKKSRILQQILMFKIIEFFLKKQFDSIKPMNVALIEFIKFKVDALSSISFSSNFFIYKKQYYGCIF